jgi:hypothetical protein
MISRGDAQRALRKRIEQETCAAEKKAALPPKCTERYVLILVNGSFRTDFYHFWDKETYGEPQFGDYYGAKKMTAQGCASAMRMLLKDGYKVERRPVHPGS